MPEPEIDFDPYQPPRAPLGPPRPEIDFDPDVEPIDNPWASIWTRPRATIRFLVATDPTGHVALLAILSGMNGVLVNLMSPREGFPELEPAQIAIGTVLLGPIGGLIGLYLSGFLLSAVGRWFGGRATPEHVRTAFAWASVPTLPALALGLLVLAFGRSSPGGLGLLGLAQTVLGIWGLVLYFKGLGEVHGFSAWTAFASAVVASVLVLAVVFAVVVLVVLARGGAVGLP